ncbi:MAG: hypothetical protein MJZ13_05310 [Bacteroidales bacterium]|nr:hypothetical protein [Bacteroidales bacterium]
MKKKVLYLSVAALLSMGFVGCIEEDNSEYAQLMRDIKIEKEQIALETLRLNFEEAKARNEVSLLQIQKNLMDAKEALADEKYNEMSFYSSRYANAITALATAKAGLESSQRTLDILKQFPKDNSANEALIAHYNTMINNETAKIEAYKKYSNYSEDVNKLWADWQALENQKNFDIQARDAAKAVVDGMIIDDFSKNEFAVFISNGGKLSCNKYDLSSAYTHTKTVSASDFGYSVNAYFSNDYLTIASKHYEYDEYSDMKLSETFEATTSYSSSYAKEQFDYYLDLYDGVECEIELVKKVYDFCVNFDTYKAELSKAVAERNKVNAERNEAIRTWLELCDVVYEESNEGFAAYIALNNAKADYNDAAAVSGSVSQAYGEYVQGLVAAAEQNIKSYKNLIASLMGSDEAASYQTRLAQAEAAVTSCTVEVEAAQKLLDEAKAQYEAFVKGVTTTPTTPSTPDTTETPSTPAE